MIKLLVFLAFVGTNGVTVASTPLGFYETIELCEKAINEYVPTIWPSVSKSYGWDINVYPVCYKEGDFWK